MDIPDTAPTGGWCLDAFEYPRWLPLEAYIAFERAAAEQHITQGWHPSWLAKSVARGLEVSTVFLSWLGRWRRSRLRPGYAAATATISTAMRPPSRPERRTGASSGNCTWEGTLAEPSPQSWRIFFDCPACQQRSETWLQVQPSS